MLQEDFYTILSSEFLPVEDQSLPVTESFRIRVHLDPGHRIYQGHFPGSPVVPGVCQIQMVKEGLETMKQVHGMLTVADNVKFLSMIVPSEHPDLTIEYTVKPPDDTNLFFSAIIRDGETVFLKFKGTLCTKLS